MTEPCYAGTVATASGERKCPQPANDVHRKREGQVEIAHELEASQTGVSAPAAEAKTRCLLTLQCKVLDIKNYFRQNGPKAEKV